MNKEVVRTNESPAEQKEKTTSIKGTNTEERKVIEKDVEKSIY